MPRTLENGRALLLALVCAAVLVEGAAAAVTALATRFLFSGLHQSGHLETIWLWALMAAGLCIAMTRIAARASGEALGQSYIRDARIAFFDHHAHMAKSDLDRIPRGYLSLRFVGDMGAIGSWFGEGLPQMLGAIVLVPTALAVLLFIDLRSGLHVLPLVIASTAAIVASGVRLQRRHADIRSRRAAIAARMSERLEQAAYLRMAGRLRKERDALAARSSGLIEASVGRVRAVEALRALPELTLACGVAILFFFGSSNGTDPAGIAGGIAALAIAVAPLRQLVSIIDKRSACRVARSKLEKALKRPVVPLPGGRGTRLDGPIGVAVTGLGLGPLKDVTFDIPAGRWATLRGPSGSGKSLLLSALSGMESPDAGEIHYNGHALADLSSGTLRHRVALVSAECPILRGSLRRTLSLLRHDRPEDTRLLQIVARVGLNDLLDRIGGLDGKLAEGGRSLSTGERIRISMAQAMLAKPGLVLIDDIWPALDRDTRDRFRDWLTRIGATVLSLPIRGPLSTARLPSVAIEPGQDDQPKVHKRNTVIGFTRATQVS